MSWHPHEDGPLSIVDLQLKPDEDGTRVDLYHEGEGIAKDGAGDKSRWDAALGRLRPDACLIPSHPGEFVSPHSAFVSRDRGQRTTMTGHSASWTTRWLTTRAACR